MELPLQMSQSHNGVLSGLNEEAVFLRKELRQREQDWLKQKALLEQKCELAMNAQKEAEERYEKCKSNLNQVVEIMNSGAQQNSYETDRKLLDKEFEIKQLSLEHERKELAFRKVE